MPTAAGMPARARRPVARRTTLPCGVPLSSRYDRGGESFRPTAIFVTGEGGGGLCPDGRADGKEKACADERQPPENFSATHRRPLLCDLIMT